MEAPAIKQAALECIQTALLACLVVAVASACRHCRGARREARKRRSAGTSTRSTLVGQARLDRRRAGSDVPSAAAQSAAAASRSTIQAASTQTDLSIAPDELWPAMTSTSLRSSASSRRARPLVVAFFLPACRRARPKRRRLLAALCAAREPRFQHTDRRLPDIVQHAPVAHASFGPLSTARHVRSRATFFSHRLRMGNEASSGARVGPVDPEGRGPGIMYINGVVCSWTNVEMRVRE